LALAGCQAKGDGAIHLRYASPYPPNHPFSRADIAWMRKVEQDSRGRLKIDPYWGGVTISSDQSVFELRHGVADIALITPIYQRAGVRAIKAQTGFYVGATTPQAQVAVYRCLQQAFPELDHELAGVRVLAVQGGNLANIITRGRPVRSLDDLRGLRLRAPTEVAVTLQRLGADPSTMPMAEVYSALSKGTIDGVVAPQDTLKALHFSEVARYVDTLSVARGGYPARAISNRTYDALPADLRRVLDQDRSFWEAALAREVLKGEEAGAAFGHKAGVRFTAPRAGDQARFDAIEVQVAADDAAKLLRFGIDGPSMLAKAQSVIAAGPATACPGA
jgi:TRAP-type C4-dicarboxylate transport system substrate-binding protein